MSGGQKRKRDRNNGGEKGLERKEMGVRTEGRERKNGRRRK